MPKRSKSPAKSSPAWVRQSGLSHYTNFDGSTRTAEDERRQDEACAKLREEKINPSNLTRLLLLNDLWRRGTRLVRDEKVAVEKRLTWKHVVPVQRSLGRALDLSEKVEAIPREWKQNLLSLYYQLNRFCPDPVCHDARRAGSVRRDAKVDVTPGATTARKKQQSRFAGALVRRTYTYIYKTLEKRVENDWARGDIRAPDPTKTKAAYLTATYLSATCPGWFGHLTTEQVRKRVDGN